MDADAPAAIGERKIQMTGTKTLTEPNAFSAGQDAYRKGLNPREANPYKSHQKDWKRWVNGYQAAQLAEINARKLPDWAAMEAAEK